MSLSQIVTYYKNEILGELLIGIPDENLQKIFDPYFTTKEMATQKGMGLGLSICYSIIKGHNGLITVKSEVGAGAIFHIYLPVSI